MNNWLTFSAVFGINDEDIVLTDIPMSFSRIRNEMTQHITIQAINQRYLDLVGTTTNTINVRSFQRWLIGSLPELIDPENTDYLRFKTGNWNIYSYYDHLWAMWSCCADFDDNNMLKYTRTTKDSSVYGFMSKRAVRNAKKEMVREEEEMGEEVGEDRIQEILIWKAEKDGGNVEFGRGDDKYHLFLNKTGGHINAWALLLEDVIKDVNE